MLYAVGSTPASLFTESGSTSECCSTLIACGSDVKVIVEAERNATFLICCGCRTERKCVCRPKLCSTPTPCLMQAQKSGWMKMARRAGMYPFAVSTLRYRGVGAGVAVVMWYGCSRCTYQPVTSMGLAGFCSACGSGKREKASSPKPAAQNRYRVPHLCIALCPCHHNALLVPLQLICSLYSEGLRVSIFVCTLGIPRHLCHDDLQCAPRCEGQVYQANHRVITFHRRVYNRSYTNAEPIPIGVMMMSCLERAGPN
jgi:hypothetical protein